MSSSSSESCDHSRVSYCSFPFGVLAKESFGVDDRDRPLFCGDNGECVNENVNDIPQSSPLLT